MVYGRGWGDGCGSCMFETHRRRRSPSTLTAGLLLSLGAAACGGAAGRGGEIASPGSGGTTGVDGSAGSGASCGPSTDAPAAGTAAQAPDNVTFLANVTV